MSPVSRPSRTRSRSGRPARRPVGTARSPRTRRPHTPRHANAVIGSGRGSARERAESRLTAESGVARQTECHAHPPLAAAFPSARTSGPAQRDPPPTRKGEARATVDDEPRARPPPRGPAEPSLSPHLIPSRRGQRRRRVLCRRVATAALPQHRERRRAGGSGTPRHTSRIAREGFLTEGGSRSPPASRPSSGPQRRSGTPGEGRGPAAREETCGNLERLRSGQGPGRRACAQPPRPPAVHPPPFCEARRLQLTHTRPIGGRTAAPRRPAGARVAGPSPPQPLTRPALTRQRGARDVRSPDQAAPFPAWEGRVSLNRLDPHSQRAPSGPTRGHHGGDRRRGRWGRERHTTARPRAPERQPGALQEHRKGPGRASARAIPERAARRASGTAPPPPRRGAAHEATTTRGESEECLLRQRTPADPRRTPRGRRRGRDSEVGPGSAPQCLPTHRPQAGMGDGGNPAGGTRRTGLIHHECPPLARRGSVPARESVTSPHRSGKASPEQGRPASHSLPRGQRADQPGHPQLQDRGGRQPGRDEECLTRTARSQREWGCLGRPRCPQRGAHGGRVSPRHLPRRPQVGQRPGPKAAPGAGTLGCMRDRAHGPQQAAQARAGPASRVTGRPKTRDASKRPNLSSDRSPEDSVSAITRWPKMPARSETYTSPGDRRSSHRPRRRPREPATRASVPKIATIAARHGAPRALWSTPGHTPEQRRARDVLPATRATQGPARVSRARLGSVSGRPLVRPGHTRDRRPARCDLSGRTRAQGALSDSPRGLANNRSRQRDRSPAPGGRGRTVPGSPRGLAEKIRPLPQTARMRAGPRPGREGCPQPPAPSPVGPRGSRVRPREPRRAGRPTPAAPHPALARKRSDNLSPHKPARLSSDSQVTRQSSGATGTARLTTAVFPELCLAHSGDGPLPRQLPPQLRKPRERYKSGRQMESDKRRERHQDRSGWQAGPRTAKPKP